MNDWLLRDQQFTKHLTPRNLDFQLRFPGLAPIDKNSGSVVLFTRSTDKEADGLSLRLAAAGLALQRINCDALPESVEFTPDDQVLSIDIHQHRALLVWTRAWTTAPILKTGDPLVTAYMREQWESFRLLLSGLVPAVSRAKTAMMVTRSGQVHYAASGGASVAGRAVTTDPVRMAAQATHDTIHKSLGSHFLEVNPGELHGLFPVVRRPAQQVPIPRDELAPTLIERFIPHESLLRVYVVGEQLIAYSVREPNNRSLFEDPYAVDVDLCQLERSVAETSLRIAEQFDNPILALDYLVADDGEKYFLEANVDGDWLPYEQLSGTSDVSNAVEEYVKDLLREVSHAQ